MQVEKERNDLLIQLKEAQRIAHLGHWELDHQTNTMTWSDEVFRIFNMDSADFQARYETFLETVHPEDRDRVHSTFINSIKNGSPYNLEHRVVLSDGEEKWLQNKGKTDYDDCGTPICSIGTFQDISDIKKAERIHEQLIDELQNALDEVKTLKGFIPICAKCKKIRDDKGYWNQIESYIEQHSDAQFSHGLCIDCSDELYGNQEWYRKGKKEGRYD